MDFSEFSRSFSSTAEASDRTLATDIFWRFARMPNYKQKVLLLDVVESGVKIDVSILANLVKWFPKTSGLRATLIGATLQVIRDRELNKALGSSALASAAMSGVLYSGRGLAG
jgi:hypothetical protein